MDFIHQNGSNVNTVLALSLQHKHVMERLERPQAESWWWGIHAFVLVPAPLTIIMVLRKHKRSLLAECARMFVPVSVTV